MKKLKHLENQDFVEKYKLNNKLNDILKNRNNAYYVFLLDEAEKIIKENKKEKQINEILDYKEEEETKKNIADYFKLKVSEKKVKENEIIKDKKKLIIV